MVTRVLEPHARLTREIRRDEVGSNILDRLWEEAESSHARSQTNESRIRVHTQDQQQPASARFAFD